MKDEIKITITKATEKIAVITISGIINIDSAEELYQLVQTELLEQEEYIFFIFNMDEVEYVSSAGVAVFIDIYDKIENRGGKICLLNPKPGIRRVFELIGFMKYFMESKDLDEAIEKINA